MGRLLRGCILEPSNCAAPALLDSNAAAGFCRHGRLYPDMGDWLADLGAPACGPADEAH